MIWEDCELLAELAWLNSGMSPLAMRIMDGNVSVGEQQNYTQRMVTADARLRWRANRASGLVVEGQVLANGALALPAHTAESHWSCEQW